MRALGTIHRTPNADFDSGTHQIVSQVQIKASPSNLPADFAEVRLHEASSGRLVRTTWADPATGNYSFTRIRNTVYYVLAIDRLNRKNGEIATNITPSPMP